MTITLKKTGPLLISALLGVALTVTAYSLFVEDGQTPAAKSSEKTPLYWVAPMDPNYTRDKPGKSPMGMDLIPVYDDGGSGSDTGPGTIKISPEVINNLGVRTALVARKALHTEIKTVGYVKYDEDQLVHIHPRVEGWIEKLYIKAAGDPVEKGQMLYEIYSPALVNAQEELVIALGRNNARLIRAAEDRLNALRLPKDTIQKLKKTKKVTQTITIYAPKSGVVDNLNIREGFYVKPGTTLMSIGTLDQVWVEAEVFERQAFQVSVGLPVTMSLDYLPGKTWAGKVDYIYPALNAKTRTLKVRLRFDNENDELKPNMFAQVVIHAESTDNSLLIPKEAVIRSGSFDRVVLALGEGRFKSVKVKVGRFDVQSAEILSGLEAGEKIVVSAQFLLDSESSKTSDFKRMNAESDEERTQSPNLAPSLAPASVWVEATINSLMAGHRMINVSHEAIKEWQWPKMTMDFTVAEQVTFSDLKAGMALHIEITKQQDGQYLVSNVHIPASPAPDPEMDPEMDHENMDHSEHNQHDEHNGHERGNKK
ncbi:MAG: efflux RND transporter periplasmic adaptor subunit [Emcibacter sp.]|nr:efflux RND transporter periplasmic adaptor subunit [Emcibacter sp.]